MGRLGKVISQQKAYDEQQKKLEADAAKQTKAAAGGDTRPIANKIFDALNPLDSGRSFTTATPDKKAAKKSAGDQAKSALGGVVDSITSPFKRLGAGGAEVLNEVTGGADREQEAYQKSQDDNMAILKDTRKKIKAETDPAKKARLQKAADVISGNMDDANKSRTKRLNEVIDRTDPVKAAASVGEVGLDVLTAGTGGAAVQGGKLAAKEAAKETVEAGGSRLAKRIAQTAATAGGQGGTSGALSAVEQKGKDVSLKDVATGALGGAVTGAAFGGGAAGLGEVIRNLPKGEGGFVKNPFYKAQIGDDLANEIKNGKVHGDITEHPTENLQLGSDTVSDPLDRATVDNYKAKLQNGEGLDPILVHTSKDGVPMIQDGAHRYQAAKELGIKDIPTVEKANNVVMAEKVTPPTEASLSAQVEKAPSNELDRLQSIPRDKRTPEEKTKLDKIILDGYADVRKKMGDDQQFYDNFLSKEADKPTRSADLAMEIIGQHENDGVPIKDAIDNSIKPDAPVVRTALDDYHDARSELSSIATKNKQPQLIKQFNEASKGMSVEDKTKLLHDSLDNFRNKGGGLIDLGAKFDDPNAPTPAEPTLTQISDSAGGQRPDAEIQKAIEDAHNGGDDSQAAELIKQLSPDMQTSMRSALGIPEPKTQLKVLDDLQREADTRTPGGAAEPAKQAVETKTQQGAQYLVDDIDKLQKETGIEGVQPLDREVASKLTGETHRTNFQEFKDKMGRNFQDTLTYGARTLGKTGSDFVYNMLQGNKFKRDALDALRENMSTIGKLNKDIAGKSVTAKRDLGARLGQALDDRANADNFLKTPQEKDLFNQYVNVFDYVKQLREKSGLETLDNYRPWVDMKDASEPPTWLSENVTNKRTQTLSRFSKERTKTAPGANVDNNLADMIYGYVNSQLNEMAYDAPVKKLKGGLEDLSSGNKANVGAMNEGIDYMRELVQQAVNPARKNPLERAAGKLTSNVYGAVLPFNVRLAIQNKTQQFVANSRVSKGAVSLAKKLSESDAKELEGGLVFGDTTVYGQLEDVNPTKIAKKGIGQKLAKVDPYQKSEHGNVITSYHKGAMQAVLDSQPYKDARASGLKPIDAVHQALQNPDVKEAAIRRGNVVVNDTQFGASPLARPEMLREEGSIWGVLPKKTVYMFTRFPIGMSQHVLELLDNKSARASEMLKNGDPRAVSVSEMRTNYQALLSSMKDAKVALKDGTDIGIPGEVLNKQIATVSKNLSIIDKESKNLSSIRGGKTVKNVAKMWAAAAAIQIIFDGGIQNFANDPGGTTAKAISQTNPTMGNRVVGEYSPLASISSSASPINKYGKLNTRAVANYIPGVGLAVNRGRDVKKVIDSLTGSSNDQ